MEANSPYAAPATEVEIETDLSDQLMVAYLGRENPDFYLRAFSKFDAGGGILSWNWPAFLCASPWFLYRRLWGWFAVSWILLPIVAVFVGGMVSALHPVAGAATITFIWFFLPALFANRLFYGRAKADVNEARSMSPRLETQVVEAERRGGTYATGAWVFGIIAYAVFGLTIYQAVQAYRSALEGMSQGPTAAYTTAPIEVREAVAAAEPAMQAVEDFFDEHGRFPVNNSEAQYRQVPSEPAVSRMFVDEGRVVIEFSNQAHEDVAKEQLFMIPAIGSEELIWTCGSASIKYDLLPRDCR